MRLSTILKNREQRIFLIRCFKIQVYISMAIGAASAALFLFFELTSARIMSQVAVGNVQLLTNSDRRYEYNLK